MSTPSKFVSKDGAVSSGPTAKRSLFMRYGMLVCCVAMMLPIAGYLLSGGTFGGLLDNLALVVPLLACVGTHFALHRLTGKACHGGHDERDAPVRPARPGRMPGATWSHWTDVIHADRPAYPAPPAPTNADVRSKVRSRGSGKGLQQ